MNTGLLPRPPLAADIDAYCVGLKFVKKSCFILNIVYKLNLGAEYNVPISGEFDQ